MAAKKTAGQRAKGPRGANPETPIQQRIRLALGMEPDLYLMRNHVGGSEEYDIEADKVRHQRFGLAKGSADLVGILSPTGRWFCLEVKTAKGATLDDQLRWHALARKFGAFVAIARSPEEARAALDRARRGESE